MSQTTSPPQYPTLYTWQLFAAYRRILGDAVIEKIYKRGIRQIQRWSADPRFVSEAERNPLDRIELILERLVEIGREDIAEATVARLARVIGCRLVPEGDPVPDKEDWRDEIIDDYPAVTEFHIACQKCKTGQAPPELVSATCDEAIRELIKTKTSVLKGNRK